MNQIVNVSKIWINNLPFFIRELWISTSTTMRPPSWRRVCRIRTTVQNCTDRAAWTDNSLLDVSSLLLFCPVSDPSGAVLVCGNKNRNRAVHGDTVVVELLPKSEWRGKVTALSEGEEKSGEDNESKPMPTGETTVTAQRLTVGP